MEAIDINEFLSLIQLAAGLNVACVAVGISQGYIHILLDKVFNVKNRISEKFEPINATILINQKTLETIVPSVVDGKNTNNKIEDLKRRYEKLAERIRNSIKNIENYANNTCEFRCFSGLSLMMFLYCCAVLFIGPLYCDCTLRILSILVLCHSIFGWFYEKHNLVCKLKYIIWEFVAFCILSFLIGSYIHYCTIINIPIIWTNIFIIVMALLPIINFVAFFVKSNSKMKDIVNEINDQAKSIIEESCGLNKEFDFLQNLEQFKMDI